jgi:hypothetical protein
MAQIWDLDTADCLDPAEFLEHVQATAHLKDVDSLAECAPQLRALANNRSFVLDAFHAELKEFWSGSRRNAYQPQSIHLTNSTDFYVRANIWLPVAQGERTELFQKRLYSYDLPHDHNFNFLTVGYFGPGYTTDVFEYEWENCLGYVGERAQTRFLGRYQLHPGRVMLYRGGPDIHIQYSPDDVSVSLNLMGRNVDVSWDQQYIFDVEQDRLVGGAGDLVSNRLYLIEAAEFVGNDETADILRDLVRTYPCDKSKARAIQSLDRLDASQAEQARSDASERVRALAALPLITGNYARSYSGV